MPRFQQAARPPGLSRQEVARQQKIPPDWRTATTISLKAQQRSLSCLLADFGDERGRFQGGAERSFDGDCIHRHRLMLRDAAGFRSRRRIRKPAQAMPTLGKRR